MSGEVPGWDARFASAPTDQISFYEETLVPAAFAPCADRLLSTLPDGASLSLLDVGTGTGVVASAAVRRFGVDAVVVGADLSPAMIAAAQRRVGDEGLWPRFVPAPVERLPFPVACFDVVTCQHVLQFVPDVAAALVEMRRLLIPGGRVLLMIWDGLDAHPLIASVAGELERSYGEDAARAFAVPWSLPLPRLVESMPPDVGETVVRHEVIDIKLPHGVEDLLRLVEFSPAQAVVGPAGPAARDAFAARLAAAVEEQCEGSGALTFTGSAIVVEASCEGE